MTESTHVIGETYFTANGEKVYLQAITMDGKFVVQQIMRYSDYGDHFYEDVGQSTIVDKLFACAPVAVIDERFEAAADKLAAIEEQYSKRYAEVHNAEREIKDRLSKLKKYQGLELLEDFIDDKITHFVVNNSEYSADLKIVTRDDTIAKGDASGHSSYDKTLKLVTLFGKSGGDLQWKVNRYYDGSGDYKPVWPCRDEEHAKQTIAGIYQKMVDDHFPHAKPGSEHWFLLGCDKARSVGIELTAEVEEKYAVLKRGVIEKQVESARKELAKAQANLDAILVKAGDA